jgi:Baseplate J-like protein
MCKDGKDIDNVIFKRNGANQEERFNSVLDPKNLELHDFDMEDWLLFAYNFAKHVNFFDINDSQNPTGNWQEIFNHFDLKEKNIPKRTDKTYNSLKENISKILSDIKIEKNLTPHITLFVCFLKILELSKKRFNLITKKHLDFFYQDILKIERLPAQADKVHILFELAQKSIEERIMAQTELDAGKDPSGKKLIYKTTEELIANKTNISHLKSVYNDIKLGEIKYSEIANSLDGKGETLKEEAKYWFPFGYTSAETNYTELQDAKLGFAIASELFNLHEGERNIDITITFNEIFDFKPGLVTTGELLSNISIFCSGEKNWLGSFNLVTGSSITGNQLRLMFQISKDTPAIVNYNQKNLGEYFSTSHPIIRFLINTENKKGHTLFRNIVTKTINNINIKVDVKDVKSLLLESDTGLLNAEKPFYPFTTQPIKDSSFIINYPEIFSKKWKNLDLNITWKNTPRSFVTHYFAYKEKYLTAISQTIFNEGMLTKQPIVSNLIANQPEEVVNTNELPINPNEKPISILDTDITKLIVQSDNYFKGSLSILNKEVWDSRNPSVILFNDPKKTGIYETNVSVDGSIYNIDKSGPIRLTLNQSFLHSLYSKIYVLAILSRDPETLIPNEAYTPLVESISLNYKAEETTYLNFEAYESNRIQLFHEAPFGQKEEHSYLKKLAQEDGILKNDKKYSNQLVPDYCDGGEFYIGLQDAETLQQISLLIQILEGSENPNVASFTGKQKVEWSILCDNYWKNIEDDMLANGIDNFLKSGIVKFSIPKQATKTNTLFPTNTIWVRAKMHKAYNAVCKVIDVKTQVVTAEFFDNNNDASHLNSSLPDKTIAKLINRISQVKSVSQPFNSFDGKPLEADDSYYRRISERLRHKNRAITLWDYEHLVLQEFPEVFRVKCLNHTSNDSFLSPGDVTLVVIPDIVNKNVFDIYEPRVSTATLNKIKDYINNLNTMQVEATVINPAYEKVIVKVNVKFYAGYDENFYKKQLNEDITKFLSPWAFDSTKEIIFGIELYRSVVIEYIEKLYYVDFLAELEMAKESDKSTFLKVITPSTPKHILVSVTDHIISTFIKPKPCEDPITEIPEKCLY